MQTANVLCSTKTTKKRIFGNVMIVIFIVLTWLPFMTKMSWGCIKMLLVRSFRVIRNGNLSTKWVMKQALTCQTAVKK